MTERPWCDVLNRRVSMRLQAEQDRKRTAAQADLRRRVQAGEPAAMRAFVEALAAEHRITITYTASDFCAYPDRRLVHIPPLIDREALAVALHELAHVVHPCARTGSHLRTDEGCVACESAAWKQAESWVGFDRAMFGRLKRSLGTYAYIPSTASARAEAARERSFVRWGLEASARARFADREAMVRRWKTQIGVAANDR